MRSNASTQGKFSRLFILLVTLLVVTAIPVQAANPNPGILPPNANPYGLSYGEWSARWWQWAFSIPTSVSPFYDATGANCGEGQSGHVWFLAGTFVIVEGAEGEILGQETRDCTIPVGTAVFFPILNAECSEIEGNGETDAELRSCATGFIDSVTSVSASIDGVPVEGLTPPDSPYRVESPLFVFTLPPDNILGVNTQEKGNSSQSVSDGYWLMLAPLSPGKHDVTFEGTADLGDLIFRLDITYHLTVVTKSQLMH